MRIIVGDGFLTEITHFCMAFITSHLVATIQFHKPKKTHLFIKLLRS